MRTEFKAGWGNTVKTITIGITILFGVLIAVQIRDLSGGEGSFFSYFLIPLLLVIYFVSFALRPVKYVIEKDMLTIHTQFAKKAIRVSDIGKVIPAQGRLAGAIRTLGIGGLFGFTGKYHLLQYGNMTWYVTRFDTAVVIESGKNKIAISPDDPSRFQAVLLKAQQTYS